MRRLHGAEGCWEHAAVSWERVVQTEWGACSCPDPAGRGSAKVRARPGLHLWF